MRHPALLLTASVLFSLTSLSIQAKKPTLATPQALSSQVQSTLPKVRSSCVALSLGGSGSGVIISPDGLVLTAAHMMRKIKEDQIAKITLDDGSKAEAKLLGFNRESDYALLKITTPRKKTWPHCELADTAPTTGNFCFTFAHPSGLLKGRPAQVRLGRITSHSLLNGKPNCLFADCNIQPGDSGGPLFSMTGQLIGLDSSAANLIGLNIFPAIDLYHQDKDRLLQGERWGDDSKAPDGPAFVNVKLDKEAFKAIQKEFMRRAQIQYPPTVDFLQALVNDKGEVTLDQQAMVGHMTSEAIAISRKQPLSFGLDDPDLIKLLPKVPTDAASKLPLYQQDKKLGYALAIDPPYLLTKASLIEKGSKIRLRHQKSWLSLEQVAISKEWDLALLKAPPTVELPAMVWPKEVKGIKPGSLLIAKDSRGRMIWNIATDAPRAVTKKRSLGPLKDKSIISKHRAPYPMAIRNALPLEASDGGTPVFNQDGNLIGMYIARFSRTMGLIIPTEALKKESQHLINQDQNNRAAPPN